MVAYMALNIIRLIIDNFTLLSVIVKNIIFYLSAVVVFLGVGCGSRCAIINSSAHSLFSCSKIRYIMQKVLLVFFINVYYPKLLVAQDETEIPGPELTPAPNPDPSPSPNYPGLRLQMLTSHLIRM